MNESLKPGSVWDDRPRQVCGKSFLYGLLFGLFAVFALRPVWLLVAVGLAIAGKLVQQTLPLKVD